jgi:Methyltransferase FkbM domain
MALAMCGASHVDFMKIDVEGSELEIVEGATADAWHRISKTAIEYHELFRSGCKNRLLKTLVANGLSKVEVTEDHLDSKGLGMIRAQRPPIEPTLVDSIVLS